MKPRIWRQVLDPFEKWLSLPTYDVVEVVGATILANRLPGEPLWLAIVGPSSSGKTEVVRALETLHNVEPLDGITTATLASGWKPGKSKKGEPNGEMAKYGLLARHNDDDTRNFTILIEDFSTILGKRPEFRNEIMNQFRRLYDGAYEADYGNGLILRWFGKCGMVVCSTSVYDKEMSSQNVFGDRFLVYRNRAGDPLAVAEKAGRNSSSAELMRKELRAGMAKLDKIIIPTEEIELSLDTRRLIAKLCQFVAIARTPVPRDTYKHEITGKPEIEGTGRMSSQLHQLLRGLIVLKQKHEVGEDEITLIERVSFGTIPSLRTLVMSNMNPNSGSKATDLVDLTRIPRSVLFRTLEDLQILELVEWEADPGQTRVGKWKPNPDWAPFFYHLQQSEAKSESPV